MKYDFLALLSSQIKQCLVAQYIREPVEYYFADFVTLRIFFGKKGVTDLRGTPPPLYGFFPENFSSKRAKNCVFLLKNT